MLEEILQNCTEKQRTLIGAWPLENLPTRSRKVFLKSIDNLFLTLSGVSSYNSRKFKEWFKRRKSKITKFIGHIDQGLDSVAKFDEEVKHKITQLYILGLSHRNLESNGYELKWIAHHLDDFLGENVVDISRVLDLQIKNRRSSLGKDVSFYDMEDLIVKGGIERAEYVREVLNKVKRKYKEHDEEKELFQYANGIIDSGVDFKGFCNFYLDYVTQLKDKSRNWHKWRYVWECKRHLLEAAPEILKVGGMDLMGQSVEGMDWLARKGVANLWFPKVAEFHQRGVLEQKKSFLEELAKKKRGTPNWLWDAKVPKNLQHLEDEIKLFVSFQVGGYSRTSSRKSVLSTLKKTCKYLHRKANPAKKLEELVSFRNKNKYRIEGLSPRRTVHIMQMSNLLKEGIDTLKKDICDPTKIVAELPEIYDLLLDKIPKEEALDTIKYLRYNFVKTSEIYAREFADIVMLYRDTDREISFLGKDMQSLGRTIFDLPGIYTKLKETDLEDKAKTIVNHLRKKHSRTLMTQAREVIGHNAFENFAKKVPSDIGKRDLVRIVRTYATSLRSAQNHNIGWRFENKIRRMRHGLSVPDIVQQLSIQKLIATKYNAFAGTSKIPEEYVGVVDKCMASQKNLDSKECKTLSLLMSTYLKHGSGSTQEVVEGLEGNEQLLKLHEERIKRFRNMPERTYEIKRKGKRTLRDVVNDELRQIQAIVKPLGIRVRNVSDINLDRIPEQHYEEIEIHMNNIKNAEFRNADISDVTFYFGEDFIENLQMGSFFGSCLSIGNFNFKYALQHCVDINKGVIYGKNQKGNIIARNRIALADEGIILTRFYNQDNVDEQWNMYLQDIADVTQETVFTIGNGMNGHNRKKVVLTVQDAHFKKFYGDGLSVEHRNSVSRIKGQFYCVVPQQMVVLPEVSPELERLSV